jgi:hypothetical protein
VEWRSSVSMRSYILARVTTGNLLQAIENARAVVSAANLEAQLEAQRPPKKTLLTFSQTLSSQNRGLRPRASLNSELSAFSSGLLSLTLSHCRWKVKRRDAQDSLFSPSVVGNVAVDLLVASPSYQEESAEDEMVRALSHGGHV